MVRGEKIDTLVVLAGGTLHFVQLQSLGLQVVHRLDIGRGTVPVVMVVIQAEDAYVVIHQHQGFITVVDATSILQETQDSDPAQGTGRNRTRIRGRNNGDPPTRNSKPSLSRKRARVTPTSRTYAIGHVSVVSIVPLKNATPSFALLYRDLLFTYSLRHYAFSGLDAPLRVSHQMRDFHEAPLLAFAASGGVVVMSDLRCYYFPAPGVQAVVRAESEEHITSNSAGDVVTLDLLAPTSVEVQRKRKTAKAEESKWGGVKSERAYFGAGKRDAGTLLGAAFLSHAQTSSSDHIIVSDMGHTLQLKLDCTSSAAVVAVHSFSMADLGWSTIASSIVQISQNVLFAASRLSRSALFQLVPHVSVLAFLPSSPPVVDIAVDRIQTGAKIDEEDGYSDGDLVIAQGGFYAGELAVRSLQQYEAVCILVGSVAPDASNLQVESTGREIMFSITGPGWKQKGTISLGLTPTMDSIVFQEKENIVREPDLDLNGLLGVEPEFIKTLSSGKVYLKDSLIIIESNIFRRFPLPDFSQPTSLEIYEEEDIVHVVVLTWSGCIFWVTVEDDIHLYAQEQLPLQGNISTTIHSLSEEKKLLVAVDSVGNFVQRLFIKDNAVSTVQVRLPLGNGPYMFIGRERQKLLLLRSANKICCLLPMNNGPFLEVSEIVTTKWHILDCQNAGDGRVIVLHPRGTVNLITFDKVPVNNNTYFSDELVLKALKRNDSIVAVQLQLQPNRRTGLMDRITTMSLFGCKSLKMTDSYTQEVTSICFLGDNDAGFGPNHFVTSSRSDDPNKVLTIFDIRKGKIVRVAQPEIVGSYPKPFSVSRVTSIDGKLHAVGNAYVVLTLSFENNRLVWRGEVKGTNSSFGLVRAIDVCKVAGQVFVADVSQGILTYTESTYHSSNKTEGVWEPLLLPFSPCFVTAIAGWGNLVVYGDSVGNVGAFSVQGKYMGAKSMGLFVDHFSYKQVFGCNIGDAVNTICVRNRTVFIGTSGGGIFRIDDISVSDDVISECELQLQDWQVFDKTEHAAAGLLDGDSVAKMGTHEADRVMYYVSI